MKLHLGRHEIEITGFNIQTHYAVITYRVCGKVMFHKRVYCYFDKVGGSFFLLGDRKFYLSEFTKEGA